MNEFRFHVVNQERAGFCVSLQVQDAASIWHGESEPEVKPPGSCVEGDVICRGRIHIQLLLFKGGTFTANFDLTGLSPCGYSFHCAIASL